MNVKPILTIGMAHHRDFDGVYFTIQNIRTRLAALGALGVVEFVVVDNSAKDEVYASTLISFCNSVGAKYVPYTEISGTSASRDAIFIHATAPWVLVIDCHVWFMDWVIPNLLKYVQTSKSANLLQGPLVMDGLHITNTHYNDQWRDQMWGTWGVAWVKDGHLFTCVEIDNKCEFRPMPEHTLPAGLPVLEWHQHENALVAIGAVLAAPPTVDSIQSPPFKINGQGMGLYLTRRDAWLGYNVHARGFGAEEMCIQAKYTMAGRATYCLPWLQWGHRFGRTPDTAIRYVADVYSKVRNYVLWFNELGMDLSPIHTHFVIELNKMREDVWQWLIADPMSRVDAPTEADLPVSLHPDPSVVPALFDMALRVPRDLDQHMVYMRDISHGRVFELSERAESTLAFLASPHVTHIYSHQLESTLGLRRAWAAGAKDSWQIGPGVKPPDGTDIHTLFIDLKHTYDSVISQLRKWGPSVNGNILLHDTTLFGLVGEDGGKGIRHAIADFLYEFHDMGWVLHFHTDVQYGLTVLSNTKLAPKPLDVLLPGRGYGPGTELKKILATLGVVASPTCDCNAKAAHMDALGTYGCDNHFTGIENWLLDNQERWGWGSMTTAAIKSLVSGMAFKLIGTHPVRNLLRLAIEQSKQSHTPGATWNP